tara:strand:- start:129 stop:428 length:300 start_codon:yes stop_codon:yes gene_type:complete
MIVFAEENKNINEIEIFANKYLEKFEDKLSSDNFKITFDVNDSEIVIDKNYGTFKYKFDKYHIDSGKMIIEKNLYDLNFKLISDSINPSFSINYQIKFN